ncbi:MAG: hypothetical protein RJQ14_15050, partial [Marinoscillum sp.]
SSMVKASLMRETQNEIEPELSYTIKNVPASERPSFHLNSYKQTKNLKEGDQILINVIKAR